MPPSPALARAGFNWRKLAVNGSYSYIRAQRNALGPFDVPASGTLDTEWGKGPADNPYRINVSLVSTQLKNVTANFGVNASDGFPYTELTGFDDNHDGLLNDRPAGVGIWSLHRIARRYTRACQSAVHASRGQHQQSVAGEVPRRDRHKDGRGCLFLAGLTPPAALSWR